ncbi:MAG: hypothetical protein H7Z72_04835 [Bacteroidetes bacterium]|nr:hypothetical protein [Fibrella sp.]
MILTFGQYNTLVAAHRRVAHDQLTQQTEFTELMISYYLSGLLANGLITAIDDEADMHYKLTDTGIQCLIDYERQNPELIVARTLYLS